MMTTTMIMMLQRNDGDDDDDDYVMLLITMMKMTTTTIAIYRHDRQRAVQHRDLMSTSTTSDDACLSPERNKTTTLVPRRLI